VRTARHAGVWQHMGFGFFAIEEKETGQLVGEAGFHEMRRAIEPSVEGALEAGWALMPTGQGWGYATEAMTAAIGWAEASFPGMRMTCIIDPNNLPSIRVALRLRFAELARTTYHGDPIAIFERLPA
jgi:RimJ/RimL family protein N-acetyltransferase